MKETPGSSTGAFLVRVSPDDEVILANSALAEYLGVEKAMLVGCDLSSLAELAHGEIRECFLRQDGRPSLNHLVTDENGRVFEVKSLTENGVLDLIFDEVTPGRADTEAVARSLGMPLEELTEEEQATLRRPDRRVVSLASVRFLQPGTLTQHLAPLELRLVLETLGEALADVVRAHGGAVMDLGEGGVSGIFGAPRSFVDHPFRALMCLREQLVLIGRYTRAFRTMGKTMPVLTFAATTGEVVVGAWGSELGASYRAVGSAMEVVRQLLQLARPGEALVTEDLRRCLEGKLPDGWFLQPGPEGEEPDLTGLSWRGQEVQPLNEDLERQRWWVGSEEDYARGRPAVELEYLWTLQPDNGEPPVPILRAVVSSLKSRQAEVRPETGTSSFVQMLGKYRLLKMIGAGGMGKVWKAEDRFGNVVALKTLHTHDSDSEQAIRRFRREAEVMAKLPHRNICRIFETGEAEGIQFLVMEFVDGVSLADLLIEHQGSSAAAGKGDTDLPTLIAQVRSTREGGADGTAQESEESAESEEVFPQPTSPRFRILPLEQSLSIITKICEAVQFAHEHGILHRDLKPGNILLRVDGEPLVADFGLAKFTGSEATQSLSVSGHVVGTLANMAPEQAESSKDVDERADVYAIGTILYQMVTGRRHFQPSGNFFADVQALSDYVPPSARQVCPSCDPDLDIILRKALRPYPTERYRNVAALAEDLDRYRRGEAISARRLSPAQQVTRLIRRHRAISGLVAVFIVLTLLGTTVAFWEIQHRATEAAAHATAAEEARREALMVRQEAEEARRQAEAAEQRSLEAAANLDAAVRDSAVFQETARELETTRAELERQLSGLRERAEGTVMSKQQLEDKLKTALEELEAAREEISRLESVAVAAPERAVEAAPEDGEIASNWLGLEFIQLPGTSLYLGATLVRLKDFRLFMQETGHQVPELPESGILDSPDHPVTNINYEDAVAFADWLSSRAAVTYRLPTRGEWLQAVQASTQIPHPEFPWGQAWPPPTGYNLHGSLRLDPHNYTSPVTKSPVNRLGFYDLTGNTVIWTSDPVLPNGRRQLVGASWATADRLALRTDYSTEAFATTRHPTFGFRLILERGPAEDASSSTLSSDSAPEKTDHP